MLVIYLYKVGRDVEVYHCRLQIATEWLRGLLNRVVISGNMTFGWNDNAFPIEGAVFLLFLLCFSDLCIYHSVLLTMLFSIGL